MSRSGNPPKGYLVKGTHLLLKGRRSAYRRIVQIYNPTTLPFPLLNIYCHTTLLLYYVQPKLVNLKYAKRLQAANQSHRGWRGVANNGTSPRACGWEEYLPHALIGEAARGISRSHIGNSSTGPLYIIFFTSATTHRTSAPQFSMNPSGGLFDYAQSDIFLCCANSFSFF